MLTDCRQQPVNIKHDYTIWYILYGYITKYVQQNLKKWNTQVSHSFHTNFVTLLYIPAIYFLMHFFYIWQNNKQNQITAKQE
jgi:hypothetical protein